jgi:ABC-type polysaccharide/polyol phosphate transport system ATPase subunit
MGTAAIQVEGVSKCYPMRGGKRTLKQAVLDTVRPGDGRRQGREFWALRDIEFAVAPGETLGMIGANGAGKSTLLALLAGTKRPTTGRITTHGTISSLLELGAGFHPDLTGRENVFLAGAVMGLTRKTMQTRFDAIIAFAGIEEFIDQPVKHYSSGMYVRLGFAVAVEVDPDILLIDEVLAVGDLVFQRKCLDKMDEFRRRGKTMLIISHDLNTIQSISDRILLLDAGRVTGIGDPPDMIARYQEHSRMERIRAARREWGTGEVKITGVEFRNAQGVAGKRFRFGEAVEARISYEASRRIENPVFGFSIATEQGARVYGNNTQIEQHAIPVIDGRGTLTLRLQPLALGPGAYLFSVSVHSNDHQHNYHRIDHGFLMEVEGDRLFEGVYMPISWSGPA